MVDGETSDKEGDDINHLGNRGGGRDNIWSGSQYEGCYGDGGVCRII